MKAILENGRVQRLEEVLKLVRAKVATEQRSALETFVVRYFGQVDPEDLTERQPADLYGAALSHWNFARKREPGRVRVRVFNPTIEEHGWQSTHTIIEIVNDDMPFLVDSVTMEVNRHGLTLHLISHPIVAVERAADGTLIAPAADDATDARRESFIHVEIDRVTGALKPLPASPFPAGTNPRAIAVEPDGRFAYVVNAVSNDVSSYSIDPNTGTLALVPGGPVPTGKNPRAVAIAPRGRYLYVTSYDSDSIWAYAIDRGSGALRPLLGQPFAAGKNPRGLAIDRRGWFLYCTNYGSNSVSAYRIDPATGALNAIPGSPYSTGDGPFAIAVF